MTLLFCLLNHRHIVIGIVVIFIIKIIHKFRMNDIGFPAGGMKTRVPLKENSLSSVIDHLADFLSILITYSFNLTAPFSDSS